MWIHTYIITYLEHISMVIAAATTTSPTGDDDDDDDDDGRMRPPPPPRPTLRVIVLTREAHRAGSWVTDLVRALRSRLSSSSPSSSSSSSSASASAAAVVEVGVVSVERSDECDALLLPPSGRPHCDLLVNRVSDASPPATVKKTSAILALFDLHSVPVINGSRAFAIGTSKWLHHQVLEAAGCDVPRSAAVSRLDGGDAVRFREAVAVAARNLLGGGCAWPLLWKPNGGGFGEGISAAASMEELRLRADAECSPSFSAADDGVVVIQECLAPRDGAIYRVWFARGRILAAVSVVRPPATFRGGCAGGGSSSCPHPPGEYRRSAVPAPAAVVATAWDPPADVRERVLRAAEISGADCGSLELLYDTAAGGRAYYFDLNMLSTLPNADRTRDPENLWRDGRDFYAELADCILERLPRGK
jgi:hypothetical protein